MNFDKSFYIYHFFVKVMKSINTFFNKVLKYY